MYEEKFHVTASPSFRLCSYWVFDWAMYNFRLWLLIWLCGKLTSG